MGRESGALYEGGHISDREIFFIERCNNISRGVMIEKIKNRQHRGNSKRQQREIKNRHTAAKAGRLKDESEKTKREC